MTGKPAQVIPVDRRFKHGASSSRLRRRYMDRRTREGKQLEAAMDSLIQDLGGQDNLSAGQRLLLDTIQSKLIVILQISKYVDQEENIIQKGELIPVLGKNYLAYLNALRLSLAELYKNHKGKQAMSYEKALKAIQGGK